MCRELESDALDLVLHLEVKPFAIPVELPSARSPGRGSAPGNQRVRIRPETSQKGNFSVKGFAENVPLGLQVTDGSMSHDQVASSPLGIQWRELGPKTDPEERELVAKPTLRVLS
jgi:hypothetical protein